METSRARARRFEVLYRLSQRLSGMSGARELALAAEGEVAGIFGGKVVIYLPGEGGSLSPMVGDNDRGMVSAQEIEAASWAFEHSATAGPGGESMGGAAALYLPMIAAQGTVACSRSRPRPVRLFCRWRTANCSRRPLPTSVWQ